MKINENDFEKNVDKALDLLGSLASKNRLKILCKLVEGEKRVSDLLEFFDISQSALSQNLILMKKKGILDSREDGAQIYYFVKDNVALEILNILYINYCGGENDTTNNKT
jgi:DNA-binding transcriptional ArsR family regulator